MALVNPPIRTRPQLWLGLGLLLALVWVHAPAFAEPDLPATYEEALSEAEEVSIPFRADLVTSASESELYQLRRPGVRFTGELRRVRNSMLRGLLTRSEFDFEIATEFTVPKLGARGEFIRTPSVRALSIFKPIHHLIRRTANASLTTPDFHLWKVRFTDSQSEKDYADVVIRRWVVKFGSVSGAAKKVQGFAAEIEIEDDRGRIAVLDVPMTEEALQRRCFDVPTTRANWFALDGWRQRDTKHPDGVRALPRVMVKPETPHIARRGTTIFTPGAGFDLDEELVEMEAASHGFGAITRRQYRDLVMSDPNVHFLVGRAALSTSIHGRIVAYVAYRQHAGYFEVLSAGSYPGFKELGVVEQLLGHLRSRLNDRRSFIVVNPPPDQRSLYANAGFKSWPKHALADEKWRDPHRGNAVAGADKSVPLSGEPPTYSRGSEENRVYYDGELPIHLSGAITPSQNHQEPPEELNAPDASPDFKIEREQASWVDTIEDWASIGSEEDFGFRAMNQDYPPAEDPEQVEFELQVVRYFARLFALYERATSAVDNNERGVITDAVLLLFPKSEIERALNRALPFDVPFDAIRDFLKKEVREVAQDREMRQVVKARLARYEESIGTHDQTRAATELRALVNELRRALAPEWPEFSFVSSRRMAERFVEDGRFPRYDVNAAWRGLTRINQAGVDPALFDESSEQGQTIFHLRKGVVTLRSLTVPSSDSTPKFPGVIPNVLILDRDANKNVFLAAGILESPYAKENPLTPVTSSYLWKSSGAAANERYVGLGVVRPHLWTVPLLGTNQTVDIVPSMRQTPGIPSERPTAPLKIGFWLFDNIERRREAYDHTTTTAIYLVLVSEDPKWNQVVVPSKYVEPTTLLDLDALLQANDPTEPPEPDCARILESAGRVIHDHRLN